MAFVEAMTLPRKKAALGGALGDWPRRPPGEHPLAWRGTLLAPGFLLPAEAMRFHDPRRRRAAASPTAACLPPTGCLKTAFERSFC